MDQDTRSAVAPKIGVQAQIVTGCRHCGAPGRFMTSLDHARHACAIAVNDPDFIARFGACRWPGVIVGDDDPRAGIYVGETCPNCGLGRAPLAQPVHIMKATAGWLFGALGFGKKEA